MADQITKTALSWIALIFLVLYGPTAAQVVAHAITHQTHTAWHLYTRALNNITNVF